MLITGSVVKDWFQYACERKTRYGSLAKDETLALKLEERTPKPWAKKGTSYEDAVVAALGRQVVQAKGATLRHFLSGGMPGLLAAQIKLGPLAKLATVDLADHVQFGANFPDLVRHQAVGGRDEFTIIDIKGTRNATRFHKAQVALYAILLDDILIQSGLPGRVSNSAEIWRVPDSGSINGSEYQAEPFELVPYRRMVLDFLTSLAPSIGAFRLESSSDETPFHIYFKCEECQYLENRCFPQISRVVRSERDVSAVAGMSHNAKRQLAVRGIKSVGDLADAKGVARSDGLSWSLKRKLETLVERAVAMGSNAVLRTAEPYSMLMPAKAGIRIFLVADVDPVDDMLVTLGCSIERSDGTASEEIAVLDTSDKATEIDALRRVFSVVLDELRAVASHNERIGQSDPAAIVAHLYLFEPSEALAIQAAVQRHLGDPYVRAALLDMVRMFPPDNVVAEPEYRGANHLPATAVRSVVEHLYALPVAVSYDLRQVTEVLAEAGFLEKPYVPETFFKRKFSSLLSIEVARTLKGDGIVGEEATPKQVEEDVRARLRALSDLCGWLEKESARNVTPDGGPLLRLPKKPFRFWGAFDQLDASDLDVLQAFELIENRASMLATLVDLARPPAARAASGRSMTGLTYETKLPVSHGIVALAFSVPPDCRETDVGPGSFGLIITNGAYDVLLDPVAWSRFGCSVNGRRSTRGRIVIDMKKADFDAPEFQAMMRQSQGSPDWCIDTSFKDPNTARIAGFLQYLAEGPRP